MNHRMPVIPESLYDLVLVEDPRFSPDGERIAFVCKQADAESNTYTRSIWIAAADGNSPAVSCTHSKNDYSPRWSPDGSSLLFVSGRNGCPQLYLLPLNGGEAACLTYMVGGVSNPSWSPDGRWIAFLSQSTLDEGCLEKEGLMYDPSLQAAAVSWSEKQREASTDPRVIKKLPYRTGKEFFDGRYEHVFVISASGGQPRRLTWGEFHHAAPDWTPDSRQVVTNSNREQSSGDEFFELWSTILRIDIESEQEEVIAFEVAEEGRPARVSPDGKWVAHTYVPKVASPYAEPYHVAITPLSGGETRVFSGDALTVDDFCWDTDSQHLYFILHDHGDGQLVRKALADETLEIIVGGHRMVQAFDLSGNGLSPDKHIRSVPRAACTISSPLHPCDLYVIDLNTRQEIRLTHFNEEWETSHDLSLPEEICYRGADDLAVQGWFFRPRNYDPQKSYPLAVEIHGGPQIMWGNSFWHEFQVLSSEGYYVFFCNPRGSSGYGAEFQRLRGHGGYSDMADIMTGVDVVLAQEKQADPERLVVTGGSYGGFLTGWIVGHTERFKAAVAQRGVYDEINMFGSGDIPESVEWYHNGIPRPENLLELWEYSPAAYAEKVTTPLKILHAELDYRVPVSQAETFFSHLRRRGNRDAVMVRFPREGHELTRSGEPRHRIQHMKHIVEWFNQYVQPDHLLPRVLDGEECQRLLDRLPGWKIKDGILMRTVACGTFAIALTLVERIGALAVEAGHIPALLVEGDRVTVRLAGSDSGMVNDRDAFLASVLQARALPRMEKDD